MYFNGWNNFKIGNLRVFKRFAIPIFPEATLNLFHFFHILKCSFWIKGAYTPQIKCVFPLFIHTISVIAIIYTSLTTLRQIDLKKIDIPTSY
jgi:hypothetical protein